MNRAGVCGMEKKFMQLTGLYARLEPVYREMLTVSQVLRDLCVEKSLATESEQKNLACLLAQREKLLEQAAVRQQEAAALAAVLEEDLRKRLAGGPPKINTAVWGRYISAAALKRREALLHRLELLIRETVALDAITGQALHGSLQDLARKMKKIQIEKKASKAYSDQGFQSEGFFVDSSK